MSSFVPLSTDNQPEQEKKDQEISAKIFEQKINNANELKKSGNVYFKEKNYV